MIGPGLPELCMVSQAVVKRPADWPPCVKQTGPWILPIGVGLCFIGFE